jgi:hypothetical protein
MQPQEPDTKPSTDDRFNDPVAKALWQVLLSTRFVLPGVMIYLWIRAFWE